MSSYHHLSEQKYLQFIEDIKDEKNFKKKLIYLINNEFDTTLNDILRLEPDAFIDRIDKGISFSLENIYTEECLSNKKLISIIDKLIDSKKEEYSKIIQLLKETWNTYDKISIHKPEQSNLLSNFRKHCIHTENLAHHNCGSKNNNFILAKNKENLINMVICESCKKVYYSSYILCRCNHCNIDYYSGVLTEEENPNFLVATWENYHCPQIINEKMKCIKCRELFYLDMKNGMLTCLNKRCNFISKPSCISWTCSICQEEFKSKAIPYNPLQIQIVKKAIKQTLLLKHRAHPNKISCCKLNVFFSEFFHKKTCRGILYEGELNNNMIVVCDKCQAINLYERFIWTCPKCFKKFRDTKTNENNNMDNSEDKNNSFEKNIHKNMIFNNNKLIKRKEKCRSVCKDEVGNRHSERYNVRYKIRDKEIVNLSNGINQEERKKQLINNNIEDKKEIKRYDLKLKYDSPKRNNYRSDHRAKIFNSKIDTQKEKCFKIILKNNGIENNNSDIKNNGKSQNNINLYNNNFLAKSNNEYKKDIKILSNEKNNNKDSNLSSTTEDKNEEKKQEKDGNISEFKIKRSHTTSFEQIPKKNNKRYYFNNRFKEDKKQEKNEKENIKKLIQEDEKNIKKIKDEVNQNNIPKNEVTQKNDRFLRRNVSQGNLNNKKEIPKINNDKDYEHINKRLFESPLKQHKNVRYGSVECRRIIENNKEEKDKNESPMSRNNILPYNKKSYGEIDNIISNHRKNKIRFHVYFSQSKGKNEDNKEEKTDNQKEIKQNKYKRFVINNNEEKNNKLSNDKNEEDREQENKNTADNSNSKTKESEERKNYRRFGINYKDQNKDNNIRPNEKEVINNKINDNKNVDLVKQNKENNKDNDIFSSIPENIGLQNLVGLTDKLLIHLKRRINNIFLKTKIPIFNIEDYIIDKKLGQGSYGTIFSAFKKNGKTPVYALKKIVAKSISEVCIFVKEFELVYSCNHPNIMKIYGLCLRILDCTTFAIYVLMEKSKCDWDKEIKAHLDKRKIYTEKELINILKQITEALQFLKNKFNISHRDIKPQNILVFENNKYKLADFGEAKEIKINKKLNTLRGTELYMSPALYEGLKKDKNDVSHDTFKSDVFSLGFCFLYASVLNFSLLNKVRDITDNNITEKEINNHLKKIYSNAFIQIIFKMLKVDEIQRFGFTEILEYINNNYS